MLLEPQTIHELCRDDRDFKVSPTTLVASTFLATMTAALTASAPAVETAPTAIALGVGTLTTTGLLLINTYKEAGTLGPNAEIHLDNMRARLANSFDNPQVAQSLPSLYKYLTNIDFAKSYLSNINRTSGSAIDYIEAQKNPEGVTIGDYTKMTLIVLQEMTLLTLQESSETAQKVENFKRRYGREPWSWVEQDTRRFLSQATTSQLSNWSDDVRETIGKFEDVFNLDNQTTRDFLSALLVSGDMRNVTDLLKLAVLEQMPEKELSKNDNGAFTFRKLTRSLLQDLEEVGMPQALSYRSALLRIAGEALSYLNPSTYKAEQQKPKRKRTETQAQGRAFVLSDGEYRADRANQVNPALVNQDDEGDTDYFLPGSEEQSREEAE